MGNSSSSSRHSHSRSGSRTPSVNLGVRDDADYDYGYGSMKRSSSTSGEKDQTSLAVPGSGHRRSRSANAVVRKEYQDEFPPPAYAPALPEKEPGMLSPTSARHAASATTVFPFSLACWSDTNPSPLRLVRFCGNWHVSSLMIVNRNAPMRKETQEDALEMLRSYDTVILVDDSRSMLGARWREAGNALGELASLAGQYDPDGIDIYFLNSPREGRGLKDIRKVNKLFMEVSPTGATPIGARLERLIKTYIDRLEQSSVPDSIRHVNYIVITDGSPTDEPADVIIHAARRLDKLNRPLSQLGIQFVQIGNSKSATKYLQGLDDELKDAPRDIVDTTPFTGQELRGHTFVKILLGGINRRVDRKGAQSVMGDN
ncbi:hypothetical protein DL96DRAFT_1756936 [Flagelloscypha sp. PMI_526]|nr:hypothetical protein DL96DRAFT_1756936 [Flagelloscypha sp. PMI_526]